jgi:hypothetical protein
MSTFKIKGPIPTAESNIETLADYFEVQAICDLKGEVSIKHVLKQFLIAGDEPDDRGIEDQEDRINTKLELVVDAVQRRIVNSRGNYPFTIKLHGNIISFDGLTSFSSYLYVYLLFATRLNMKEEISAMVAKSYFGSRSSALIFGTALDGGFEDKVNDLCKQLEEGGCFVNYSNCAVTENDDALDVVVWNHFEDRFPNKLVGFGQCKTGTSYEVHRHDLQPVNFCKKWLQIPLNHDPIKLFFIADVIERGKFWKRGVDAGILFDRIRIMDYLPTVDKKTEQNICNWSREAIKFASN